MELLDLKLERQREGITSLIGDFTARVGYNRSIWRGDKRC